MFAFIGALVGWIVDAFQAVTDAIVYGLIAAWQLLKAFAGIIWDAAKFSYENILKPVGLWLDKIYQRAVDLYDHYVQPVITWLQRVTALARKIYFQLLSPILATIDGLQKVLKLLELLHVQWATDIDNALAALEKKLTLPLQQAIQFLNGLINRVESYVLTAENLFQRVTHLNTLRRDLSAVQNIQWNSLLRNMRSVATGPFKKADDLMTVDEHLKVMDDVFNGNDSKSGIDVEAALRLLDDAA